jgi:hypothetical protein
MPKPYISPYDSIAWKLVSVIIWSWNFVMKFETKVYNYEL